MSNADRLIPLAQRIADLYVNRWDKHVEYTGYSIRAQREQYKKQHGTDAGFAPSYVTVDRKLSVESLNRFTHRNHILCMFAAESGSKFISFDVDAKNEDGTGDTDLSANTARRLIAILKEMGAPEDRIYPSFSGKKGFHVDLFFPKRIHNYYVRRIYNEAMNRLHALCKTLDARCCEVEFRPTTTQSIKLPLSVHKDTSEVAWFTDHNMVNIQEYDYLFKIKKLTEAETDALIALCGDAELIVEEQPALPASDNHCTSRIVNQEPSGTQRHDRMLKMALAAAYKGKQEEVIRRELYDWVVSAFGEDRIADREVAEDIRLIPQYALSYCKRDPGSSHESFSKNDGTTLSMISANTGAIIDDNSSDIPLDTQGLSLSDRSLSPMASISRGQFLAIVTARGKALRLRTGSRILLFSLHMRAQNVALGRVCDGWVRIAQSMLTATLGIPDRKIWDQIHTLCEAGLLNKCVIEMDPRTNTPHNCIDYHGKNVSFPDIEAKQFRAKNGEIKPSSVHRPIWEKNDQNRYLPLLPQMDESEPQYSIFEPTVSRMDFYRAAAQLLTDTEIRTLLSKGDAAIVNGLLSAQVHPEMINKSITITPDAA